jgi:D-alanine-D-alanine ligase
MSRIAVVTGGSTPERDVAFAGAAQVVDALRTAGHFVSVVDTVTGALAGSSEAELLQPEVGELPPTPDELRALAEREKLGDIVQLPELHLADIVFLVLHGRQGEGGEIQALLDDAGLPYAGSNAAASALAMDKDAAKQEFEAVGIPTNPWCMWPADSETIEELGFPLIVKPSKVGSSVGLSVVNSHDDLHAAVDTATIYDNDVMLEKFLPGRELTVGVLGERALAVGEILPTHDLFDYECKYTPGMTEEVFPAHIDDTLRDRLQIQALAAHRALGLRDFSRVDFKEDSEGVPRCLEANTLPGMTATSLLPQSAAAAGISFVELLESICSMAIARAHGGNKDYP